LDAWASAESSPFSLGNNSRLRGGSNNNGGGGGGNGGGGGGGGGGKKLGRVDDVRGPECMFTKVPIYLPVLCLSPNAEREGEVYEGIYGSINMLILLI